MELPRAREFSHNNISRAWHGARDNSSSVEDVLSQQEFIRRKKVQLYNSIKNLPVIMGNCEADGGDELWLVDRRNSSVVRCNLT